MKTIKILVLTLCVSFTFNSQAQNDEKTILKVNYTSGCVSDFMVGLLKKQIQDPDELSQYLSMMEGYKIHSSFYQNIKTKESVFVLDSITEVPNLSTPGQTYYVYRNATGDIFGKEQFMGKDIDFKGNVSDINWTITDEQKEINGYQCKKAYLNDNSNVYAWFTPQIPVSGAPYMFFGLPGLVLESNSPFETVNATTITYQNSEEFQSQLEEVKQKIDDTKNTISFEEIFAKKDNFQRMIENSGK